MKLACVTATVDPVRTQPWWASWGKHADDKALLYVMVINGKEAERYAAAPTANTSLILSPEPLGTVPAFAMGVERALYLGADIVAAFHDDLRIDEPGWDAAILRHFAAHPRTGLAGFSGADGLGTEGMYARPYDPMTLARRGFFSNLEDAEAHGRRETGAVLSACADGFSQIGSAGFFGMAWPYMVELGIKHHLYDGILGALARRHKLETWFLPVRCKHAGGMTAVASEEYQRWAAKRGGDHELWKQAHILGFHDLSDVLPFSVR